jgi:hypothetical protein
MYNKFKNVLKSINWIYTNTLPSRNLACLDNILINNDNSKITCGTFNSGISDHKGLWALYLLPKPIAKQNEASGNEVYVFRPLGIGNIMKFREYLQNIDFRQVYNSHLNIEERWMSLLKIIERGIQKYCPLKTSKKLGISNKKKNPWYNSNLHKIKMELLYWYRLANQGNSMAKAKYQRLKYFYRQEINKSKIEFNSKIIEKSSNMNSVIWKLIKKEASISSKNVSSEISPEEFNDHLVNISTSYDFCNDVQQIPSNINCSILGRQLCNSQNINKQLKLQETTLASIVLAVKSLKSTRSEDIYGLSSHLLKHIIDIIHEPLGVLINHSPIQGFFPDCLKRAVIVPVYKKGDKKDLGNYRPIALLPVLSKVFELILKEQLNNHLNKFDIIHDSQFGFRQGKNTTDAIVHIVNQIYNNFENRNLTLVTFMDISKAFDTISHSLLLSKLQDYGINGIANDIFKSYLLNRKQTVKINGKFSQERSIHRGVPQGSVLGPILFVLYMNDFPNALIGSTTLYADDATILTTHHDLDSLKAECNINMNNAQRWLTENDLVLNESKTVNIMFSLNKNITNMNSINNTKYLGIYIDNSLTWNNHIDKIISRLSKSVFIMRKIKDCLTINCLQLVYLGYFHSVITYGILLWGIASRTSEVFLWQKKALRILLNLPCYESCRGGFKKLNIMTVYSLFVYQLLIYMKINLASFNTNDTYYQFETRGKNLITVPRTRLAKIQNSYKVLGPIFFNLLPICFRTLSFRKFKRIARSILIESEGYSIEEIRQYLSTYDYSPHTMSN